MVNEPIKEIYDTIINEGAEYMRADGGVWIAEMIQAIAYPNNTAHSWKYEQKLIFHFGLDKTNHFLSLIKEQKALVESSLKTGTSDCN